MSMLPCIVCGKDLKSATPFEDSVQPSGGLQFTSQGHYGGTLFDPMDGSSLAVNICDDCLYIASLKSRVLFQKAAIATSWEKWKPEPVEKKEK